MLEVKKIAKVLLTRSVASFIASVDSEGFPTLKAMMLPRKIIGLKTFYFVTNTSSLRVSQYRDNPKAAIYFCDQRHFVGLMLRGKMEVLEDIKNKNMVWLESDTQYYKRGVTDPDYCVLKFTAKSGRLYRNMQSSDFIV